MAFSRVRIFLALASAVACAASHADAQAPEPMVIFVQPTSASTPAPAQYIEAKPAAPGIRLASWPLFHKNAAPDAVQSPVRSKLNQCGYCCNSHIDWYGCGGIRSELQFVFGSCRTFFSEPCFPKTGGPDYGYSGRQGGNCPHCNR